MAYVVQTPNVVVTNESHPAEEYKATFKGIGIAECVIGGACLILGIVALILVAPAIYVGAGVWGGIWYIVTGSLGIASGVQPNSCNVTAGLVISIIASIVAFVALIVDGLAASAWAILGSAALTAIHAILAILSFMEFVVAIVHAAFGCKAGCGRSTGHVIATTTVTTVPAAQVPVAQQGFTNQKM